ncbi:Zinc metalloproteinase [Mycena kentingensis (nom. inval.)]|nr:Zinc metalloproteinase [Mycena kentingensis (nom. inval.)]
MAEASINLVVSHRGTQHRVSLLPSDPLTELHGALEELTTVPPDMQKLLYKNSPRGGAKPEMTLREAGMKDGMKIQMVGSTLKELGGMQAKEAEERKRDRILRERAAKAPTKARSTGVATSTDLNYRFHKVTPLAHLPSPDAALVVLQKVANDKAIQHVMRKHQFSVGELTELDPRERPELLGLNENAGQRILLRVRTDSYREFRTYLQIRLTLCHELAHNVHGNHDEGFKQLNSQLNREVAEFERAAKEGAHRLFAGEVYEGEDEDAELTAHILGGSSSGLEGDSVDDRRRRVLAAALSRIKREEERLEESCGTAGPAAE